MHASQIPAVMDRLAANELPWGAVFTDKMLRMDWAAGSGWTAPRIEPYGPLPLPPSSSVFHYGMAVFEGMKAYRTPATPPRLFRPDLNVSRLNASAARLALPTIEPEVLLEALREFVTQQAEWVPELPGSSLYLRPTLIATDPRIGVRRSDTATLFVIASPVASFFPASETGSALQTGVDLLADATFVRAWKGGVGDCKTGGNYAASIGPAERAQQQGFDQILWLSDAERKLVTEVGMMNVFFVFEEGGRKKLVTPRLDGTILNGVIRRSVLDLAREMGIPAEERDLPLGEVFKKAEEGKLVEVFGTGTAAIVCPVRSITCEGEKLLLKGTENEDDLSVMFRERLLTIQGSGEEHPWMVPVMLDSSSKAFRSGKNAAGVGEPQLNTANEMSAVA